MRRNMGGERPFAWLAWAFLGVLFFVSFACEVKAAAIPASTEAASKAPENEYDELTTDKFNPSSIYLEGHAIPKHPLPQPKPATIVHQSYELSAQQKTELQRWNALTESKKLDEHRKAHAARARRIKQVPSKPKGSVKNAAPLKSNKPGGGGAAGAKKATTAKKTTTKKTTTAKKVRFQDVSAKRGYPACNPSGALLGVNKTQFQHITRHLELSKLAYLIGKSLKTGTTALSASGGSVNVVDILTPGVKNQIFGEFNGAAFIAVDDSKKILYLVYRGTNSIQDILSDAKFDIVDYKINGKSMGYVHQGFYELYVKGSGFSRLQAQMKKYPSYTVHFTGHSLGGALTQLASMDYAMFTGKTPFVVTFGSPRLGDSKWRTNYRPAVEHLRLIHDNDPVTQLPVFGTTNLLRGLLSLKLPDAVLYTHAADVAVKMLENGDFFCISDAVIAPDVNPLDHGVTKYIASLALMVQKN